MKRWRPGCFADDLWFYWNSGKPKDTMFMQLSSILASLICYWSSPQMNQYCPNSLVDNWPAMMNQGCKDLGGRGRAVPSQFALYLKGNGEKAYVIPTFFCLGKECICPIYSDIRSIICFLRPQIQ